MIAFRNPFVDPTDERALAAWLLQHHLDHKRLAVLAQGAKNTVPYADLSHWYVGWPGDHQRMHDFLNVTIGKMGLGKDLLFVDPWRDARAWHKFELDNLNEHQTYWTFFAIT